MECSNGCNHALEDCLCGCDECQSMDFDGTLDWSGDEEELSGQEKGA